MKVSLQNVTSQAILEVTSDPFVFGRGGLLECVDKRVSRRHGQLYTSDDGKLRLLSLHTNPCFFMDSGLPPIALIKKDENKVLKDGDYIALLPDSFWFQVIIKHENESSPNTSRRTPDRLESGSPSLIPQEMTPVRGSNVNRTPDRLESGSPSLIPQEMTPVRGSNVNRTPDRLESGSPSLIPQEMTPVRSSNVNRAPDRLESNQDVTPIKDAGVASTNTTPDRPESTASSYQEVTPVKRLSVPQLSPSSSTSSSVTKQLTDAVESPRAKVRKLPCWMYEIEGETSSGPKKTPTKNSSEPPQKKAKMSESVPPAPQTPTKTVPQQASENSPAVATGVTIKLENENDTEEKKETSKSKDSKEANTSKNEKDGYESDVVDPELQNAPTPLIDDLAGAADPAGPAAVRALCQYGANCYRKNPQHRVEFSHPNDHDWVPVENRPICQYGAMCYRQNPMHRIEFQHPLNSRPAPPPQNRAPSPPPQPAPRPRAPPRTVVESDEDDYDLDDPFINDDASSDEYHPGESESETDFSQSQETQEDLKGLKKEAKKFLRKK